MSGLTDRPSLLLEDAAMEQPVDPVVDRAALPPLDIDDTGLVQGLEAVLLVADEPVTVMALVDTLGVREDRVRSALVRLQTDYHTRDGGIVLVEVAGGWRLLTADASRPVLERWIIGARHGRLTQAALETLAVIAYRQPIGRVTIGEIRGVNPDGALRSLIARGLVAEVGRDDGPGQAVLFGTTGQFLERMGLVQLADLPPLPGFLPDGPAPDEPAASGLADLRRRLRDGSQRLGAAPARSVSDRIDDDDDEGVLPAPIGGRPREDGEIVELSDRLEQAARSAMGRLRQSQRVQAEDDAREAESAADATGAMTPTASESAGADDA
jgi:segregation and condensation protein B